MIASFNNCHVVQAFGHGNALNNSFSLAALRLHFEIFTSGCLRLGENMITLHRSSVMFYTGSKFLFASSLRSVCWCTSRFMGLHLGTCASIVRRRIHPLRG